MLAITQTNLSQIISDALKNEGGIVDRYSWEYLRDLHRMLLCHLGPLQKNLKKSDFHVLLNEIVCAIRENPCSMSRYLHQPATQRQGLLKQHYARVINPLLVRYTHKKPAILPVSKWYVRLKQMVGY